MTNFLRRSFCNLIDDDPFFFAHLTDHLFQNFVCWLQMKISVVQFHISNSLISYQLKANLFESLPHKEEKKMKLFERDKKNKAVSLPIRSDIIDRASFSKRKKISFRKQKKKYIYIISKEAKRD